jgi:hypothetical protein
MRRAHKVASGEPDARIGHGQRDACTIRHIGSLASRRSGLPVQSRGDLRELLVLMHGDQVAVLTAAMASAVCLQPPRDLLVDKGFTGKPFTAAQACRGIAVLLPPAKGQRQRMPSILRKSSPNGATGSRRCCWRWSRLPGRVIQLHAGERHRASRLQVFHARALATRDDLTALSQRNFDASTFNAWFIAFTLNSPQNEAIAVRRFRPQFRVALNAWLATDPQHNPNAPPAPTYMPQYKLPAQTKANALDNAATAKSQAGNQAGLVGDNYVRITVFPRCRAVPCWHRQLVQAAQYPLRPGHVRLRAADSFDRADPAAAGTS